MCVLCFVKTAKMLEMHLHMGIRLSLSSSTSGYVGPVNWTEMSLCKGGRQMTMVWGLVHACRENTSAPLIPVRLFHMKIGDRIVNITCTGTISALVYNNCSLKQGCTVLIVLGGEILFCRCM
ncbi:hypothetical protein SKAU_G00222020 [Synaphobranchus kaupii]|uniref:Uncharacterized protein n=1 Tax=Synaphobranchus kaupii TaxID=118154 RepID=A0A9Q1FB33_SYNKA|nr:hypothetical protein SKAU_G00222020 [Synaphobranchus kaupii]